MFFIYFLNSKNISTTAIQISFIASLVPLTVFAAYLSSKGRFKPDTLPGFVIVIGVLMRVIYTVYTPFTFRQHDVIGSSFSHLDYIKHLANTLSLPQVDYCQAYHPPVHHALSSVFYSLGKAFGFSEFDSFRLVQLFMVFLSCMTLILVYKIFKKIKLSNTVILAGISIFAFYPYNIFFASFLNNDNTMYFFYTLSFYCLIRWIYSKSIKNMVFLSLAVSLAMLTKKNAIIIFPIIFIAFMVVLYQNRKSYRPYLSQFTIFLAISIPLSFSYTLREFVLFKQGLFYSPGVGFEKYANTFKNLFYIPFKGLIKQPFTEDPYTGKSELFSDYALKSSLFGEWRFPGLETIATLLLFATIVLFIIVAIYLIIENKNIFKGYGYLFVLNLILPYALLFQSRLSNPVVCAQNFRYAALMLISVAYFYGKSVERFSNTKFKFLKYIMTFCTIIFCLLSALFILQIGAAPLEAYNYK
jgi:4-amino-4-deoxy-L-arabinose transferase-like glycosyltransferase